MKFFHSKLLLLLGCVLAANAARATSLADYGSIPALTRPNEDQSAANQKLDFQTDLFTGRFGYRVPIEVPPARGGLAPNVVLQYNSANKNGWCGVGWDLDMGYIQRETRYGVPVSGSSYSDSFGFTFSAAGYSGRLINVGGTNSYAPQIDTGFLKCSYSNGWWVCTDKSGTTYNFGETANSRITNHIGTFRWALSSIRDANGNKTLLTYTNDLGQLYLSRIDYNGNDNGATIPTNCTVAFDFASGNRLDTNSTLIAGIEIQTRKLLGAVRVLSGGQLVRRYALTYTTSDSTSRSILQKVQEFGSDNTTSLPAKTFSYSAQVFSFGTTANWSIVAQNLGGHGLTYGSAPGTPDSQLIDVNGDGLPDWVTASSSPYTSYTVQLNTGNGFTSTQYSWSPLSNEGNDPAITWNTVDGTLGNGDGSVSSTCQLIDINGDDIPDRVLRGYSTRDHFQIQTNTGTGWASRTTMTGVSGADSTYQATSTTTSDGEASRSIMMDMNGDGLPDHVMKGSANGQFDVQLNLGGSFASAIAWTNVVNDGGDYPYTPRDRSAETLASESDVYAEMMDMNGDGLPDRVLYNGVQLNNGVKGFGPYQTTWNYGGYPGIINVQNGQYTTQFIDMNGDGLPDFVAWYTNGEFAVYFNRGRGFDGNGWLWTGVDTSNDGTSGWDALQAWDANGTKVLYIDMNGDGLVDRVRRNPHSTSSIQVQLSTGPFPDLLVGVDNGIGGSVSVSYAPSTVFNNTDGTRPRLPFPVYVVTSVTTTDGHGNSGNSGYTTSYSYANGLYDTTYREFRGFGLVTQTNPSTSYSLTWFHQGGGTNGTPQGEFSDDISKAGMPYRVERYGTDNKLYTRTINKVGSVLVQSNGVYFPFVSQILSQDFEGNTGTTNYRATAQEFIYNAISNNLAASTGNLLGETNYGEVGSINISNHTFTALNTVPPFYTFYTYASISLNPNIIDRVASNTVSSDSAGSAILRQTTYTYVSDATGNVLTKNDLICSGTYATTTYGYDSYGNVLTVTDPVGIVTTSEYDSATATYPTRKYTGLLADNLIESANYDSRAGVVLLATNMQGLVTSNAYDAFFRPVTVRISTNANGSPTLIRMKYEYSLGGITGANNSSNFVHASTIDPADTTTGFHESCTFFDGLGRTIQTREESEVSGQYRVANIAYDVCGGVTLQEHPFFDSGGAYRKFSGTRTNIYTEYDPIDRPFRVNPVATANYAGNGWWDGKANNINVLSGDTSSPVGPTSTAFKDGTNPWVITVTNALGKIHKYNLDAYGRTNQIVEVTSAGNFTTTLAYNQINDLTNITDNANNQISLFYDLTGRKVAVADPDMGFWQYGLDAAGRLKVQTDAKGQQIKLFYNDDAGRLTRREGWTASGQCVSTNTYQYDSNGGDSSYTVYPGQLFSVMDDEGWHKNSYDVRDRTVKTVRYLIKNGRTYTNQVAFDNADRVVSQTYPNGGPTITNLYDLGEHLSQVQKVGGAGTVFFTAKGFNGLGQSLGVSFGNGVQTTNSYFPISKRLSQITSAKSANIQSLGYSYDAVGNMTNVADGVYSGTNSATFGNIRYDDLNRLTSLTNTSGTFVYAFDSIGNVLTNQESGTSNYVYGTSRPHAVTKANGVWYTYDQNGNVVFRGGQRLDYDVNDRLVRVWGMNGVLTTFGYDADGARLWKQSGTNALQVWIGGDYEEKNGQILFHISAGGETVCTFDAMLTNIFQYYQPNNLTSTSIQTDTNGNLVQHYEYSAFGQARLVLSATAFPVSRRYTGQILDDDTGLYYYNTRYYDPQLGRFVQPDDIIPDFSNPQSYNRYSYVLNNPLRYTDPDGHQGVPTPANMALGMTAPPGMEAEWNQRFQAANVKATALEVGALTGVAASGAVVLAAPAVVTSTTLGSYAVAGTAGATGGYVGNGTANVIEGQPFNQNGGKAAVLGAALGLAGRGISGVQSSEPSLQQRANEIHDVLDPQAQRMRTTAVTETKEGVRVVSSSQNRLSPAQRAALQPGEIEGVGPGHAETTGVNAAKQAGLTPTETAASRPICPTCAQELQQQGVKPASPLKSPK